MKSNKLFRPLDLFLICTILFLTVGCSKKDEPGSIPVVSTKTVSNIKSTTADSGGDITSDGGSSVTARGVCWSTNPDPTIANSKTIDASGSASYVSNLIELSPNTTYNVRAYATNSAGTAYGTSQSFSTTSGSITIGSQVWMNENLNVTKFRNGDPIPLVTDGSQWSSLTTSAYTNYDNLYSNGIVLGHLYNWYAVADSRNICPAGWHIPSLAEWSTLIDFLGGNSVAGGKLKDTGTTYWLSPNTGATNESVFSAFGAGHRHDDGTFGHLNLACDFWSATETSTVEAYFTLITNDDAAANNAFISKIFGFSVRCIKD